MGIYHGMEVHVTIDIIVSAVSFMHLLSWDIKEQSEVAVIYFRDSFACNVLIERYPYFGHP